MPPHAHTHTHARARTLPLLLRRPASTASSQTPPAFRVFDRHAKLLQRTRAAQNTDASRTTSYLRDLLADRIVDRLLLINRPFPRVLDLGAGACHIARSLTTPHEDTGERVSERIATLVAAEMSEKQLYRDVNAPWNRQQMKVERVVADEEHLPFEENEFDAVVSAGSMHWINDLPSTLSQVNRILRPDAPFVAAMFGGDTLFELRTSLQLAEQERLGGVSPRVSPMADTRDVGSLLDKVGFALLTVDVDDVVVGYPDMFALMTDLGAMGEGNAVLGRREGQIQREVLMAAEGIYRELHGSEDGTLPATWRIIYMIGWKKSANQPKPLARGSGKINMKVLEKK